MRASTSSSIPGPQGPELIFKIRTIQRNPLEFMLQSIARYGDFVQFPIGQRMVYLVNEPRYIKHILLDNHQNYSKDTIQYNQLARVTGRGLLTSDGEFWLRQRRLAQPAFHKSRIEKLDQVIVRYTHQMLDGWEQAADLAAPIDVDQEMMKLTLRIVGQALFSIDLQEQAVEFTRAVLDVLEDIVHRSQNLFALPAAVPTPRNRRFQRAIHLLDEVVEGMIAERHSDHNPPDDLLSMFLQARLPDSGERMTTRQIRDEILTILIAGHETVASALTWCFYLLASHATCRRELEHEIRETLGLDAPDRTIVSELEFTRAIFDETLRLYPPAWLITRRAQASDLFGSYQTPEGSLFIISPYTVHRNESYWTNPMGFDPWRFIHGQLPEQRFAYLPFGGGPRLCIGDRMAAYEAVLILAQVTQRFRLELAPGYPVTVLPQVTLRPREGLHMLPVRRSSAAK